MKFKSNLIILGIAFMGGVAMAWHSNKSNAEKSDSELANIEALTRGEIDWDYEDGIASDPFECGAPLSNGRECTYKVITCNGGGSGCNERPCSIHG